jgi:hypothetical protein
MMKDVDKARHATEDDDERVFLEMAFKTAFVDVRAGHDGDFGYAAFIDVMRALWSKKTLLKDVLDGQAAKHRWWVDV